MITIYHNSRCSKSREGVCFLENSNQEFEIINYLENKLTVTQLKELLIKLNISALDLVRKKESMWVENYKGKKMTEEEIILALIENPKLIERPIVVNGNKAVIARPSENINSIL